MQHILIIGAVILLLFILFIVIFFIVRELLYRNGRRRDRQREVGIRFIRNRTEFDEFQSGVYVPGTPEGRTAPDSGIEDEATPDSKDSHNWSSHAGSSILTSPRHGARSQVARHVKTVSFADSIEFSEIEYDESSACIPTIDAIIRTEEESEPKLTSYTSAGRCFKQKPGGSRKSKSAAQSRDKKKYDMKEVSVEEIEEELLPQCGLPVTSL